MQIKILRIGSFMTHEASKFPSMTEAKHFELYLKNDEVKEIIYSLAHQVNEQYAGQELVLICPLRGSLQLVYEFLKKLTKVHCYIDFVFISSLGVDKESLGSFKIRQDISTDIHQKNVLIIEEIIDSAKMLNFLIHRLKLAQPKKLEVLTLFDRPFKRKVKLEPDYIGKTVNDRFLIGMGLDLNQHARHLTDIYALKYPN